MTKRGCVDTDLKQPKVSEYVQFELFKAAVSGCIQHTDMASYHSQLCLVRQALWHTDYHSNQYATWVGMARAGFTMEGKEKEDNGWVSQRWISAAI